MLDSAELSELLSSELSDDFLHFRFAVSLHHALPNLNPTSAAGPLLATRRKNQQTRALRHLYFIYEHIYNYIIYKYLSLSLCLPVLLFSTWGICPNNVFCPCAYQMSPPILPLTSHRLPPNLPLPPNPPDCSSDCVFDCVFDCDVVSCFYVFLVDRNQPQSDRNQTLSFFYVLCIRA